MLNEIIGYIAGGMTTIAFLPQLIKVYKSKSAKDISFRSFFLFVLGVIGWLIYGILLKAPPIIICNALTLVIALCILALKLRFRNS